MPLKLFSLQYFSINFSASNLLVPYAEIGFNSAFSGVGIFSASPYTVEVEVNTIFSHPASFIASNTRSVTSTFCSCITSGLVIPS